MRYINVIIAALMIFGSCKSPPKKLPPSWSTITIVSDNYEVITINNYEDTSSVKSYDGGLIFTGHHKVKVDSLRTYFTMTEKDSIYKLAEYLIANPANSKASCLDFKGDLKLDVDYGTFVEPGSFRQSIEYSGICQWDTLSTETRQLKKILSRKIKWWHK